MDLTRMLRFYGLLGLAALLWPVITVVRTADYPRLHVNGVEDSARRRQLVRCTRAVPGYRPMRIPFNEDDQSAYEKPENGLLAAIGEYASWRFFDYRMRGEAFEEGYQSVPDHWGISSGRNRGLSSY